MNKAMANKNKMKVLLNCANKLLHPFKLKLTNCTKQTVQKEDKSITAQSKLNLEIALRIVNLVEERGWQKKYFAELIEVMPQHVNRIFKGEFNSLKIAEKLGQKGEDITYLLTGKISASTFGSASVRSTHSKYNKPICNNGVICNELAFARTLGLRYKSPAMFATISHIHNYCNVNGIALNKNNLIECYSNCKNKFQYLLFNGVELANFWSIQYYLLKQHGIKYSAASRSRKIIDKIKSEIKVQCIQLNINNVQFVFDSLFTQFYPIEPKFKKSLHLEPEQNHQPAGKYNVDDFKTKPGATA